MSRIQDIRKFFAALVAALAMALVAPAATAGPPEIDAAKEQGTVGERIDGYLGIVNGASIDASARRKVEEINAKRRKVYEDLARQQGATVEQVAFVTGEKLIAQTPEGQYIFDQSGSWKRK
jgi:uncharacterized protein